MQRRICFLPQRGKERKGIVSYEDHSTGDNHYFYIMGVKTKWDIISESPFFKIVFYFAIVVYLGVNIGPALMQDIREQRGSPVSFYSFDTLEIRGHLNFIARQRKHEYFSTREDWATFYDIDLSNDNGSQWDHPFRNDAQLGDSIVKYRFADTLFLFRGGRMYFYKIERPANGKVND